MSSVTQRIKEIKQPRGGYVNPKEFSVVHLDDIKELNIYENIHPSIIGTVVDYMTRFMLNGRADHAFKISIMGATIARDTYKASELLTKIKGLDDESIIAACQLTEYDHFFRMGTNISGFRPINALIPDNNTIDNIRTMVLRSISFFEKYGPITKDGFTFEGAYTDLIDSGDGDFLTKDTLWDFKVSKDNIKPTHTLQLLIYYIMGEYSIYDEFANIKNIGIYNPRLNNVYMLSVEKIPETIKNIVKKEIIGITY